MPRIKASCLNILFAVLFIVSGRNASAGELNYADVTALKGLSLANGYRLSTTDINGDGYPDIFVCTPQAVPYLYVFNPATKQYVDVSVSAGIRKNRRGPNGTDTQEGRYCTGAVFADIDNDGDMDMFSILFYNSGQASFVIPQIDFNEVLYNRLAETGTLKFELAAHTAFTRAMENTLDITSAVFCDYNYDGKIDLFLGNNRYQTSSTTQFGTSLLLKGTGVAGAPFANVTTASGIGTALVSSWAVSAFDFNHDGWIDLAAPSYRNCTPAFGDSVCTEAYTANRHSILWQNNKNGTFSQVQSTWGYDIRRGWDSHKSSFGSMPRDFDNDGKVDLLEVIVHGNGYDDSFGHSLPSHSQIIFNTGTSWDWNQLFDAFSERTLDVAPNEFRDVYGSWLDANNDGLPDVILTDISGGGMPNPRAFLFQQTGAQQFPIANRGMGLDFLLDGKIQIHNVLPIDFDQDGDEDLLLGTVSGERLYLLENRQTNANEWVKVKLRGKKGSSNVSAVDAQVHLQTDNLLNGYQMVSGGDGHQCPQRPLDLNFGLGTKSLGNTVAVSVTWPNPAHSVSDYLCPILSSVKLNEADFVRPITWTSKGGTLRAVDIGVGSVGGQTFIIRDDAYGTVYKYSSGSFTPYATANYRTVVGKGIRIDVDWNGRPWVINSNHDFFQWNGTAWKKMLGQAYDIGLGPLNSVYTVGTPTAVGGHRIYRMTSPGNWSVVSGGGGLKISVDGSGAAWVLDNAGEVSKYANSLWTRFAGRGVDVGAGSAAAIYSSGADMANSYSPYKLTGVSWLKMNSAVGALGSGVLAIDAGPSTVWMVDGNKKIWMGIP